MTKEQNSHLPQETQSHKRGPKPGHKSRKSQALERMLILQQAERLIEQQGQGVRVSAFLYGRPAQVFTEFEQQNGLKKRSMTDAEILTSLLKELTFYREQVASYKSICNRYNQADIISDYEDHNVRVVKRFQQSYPDATARKRLTIERNQDRNRNKTQNSKKNMDNEN